MVQPVPEDPMALPKQEITVLECPPSNLHLPNRGPAVGRAAKTPAIR